MNYIKQLQAELAAKQATLDRAVANVDAFRRFLSGPKFTGTDPDGSRKDWIATSDMFAWLSEQRSTLTE